MDRTVGITAVSSPSAIMSPAGALQVVVKLMRRQDTVTRSMQSVIRQSDSFHRIG